MKRSLILFGIGALLLAPAALRAQDAADCKDSPLLTRLSGCTIDYCSASDFDAAEVQTSLTSDPRTKHIEGKIAKLHYSCPGKSALQVRRNAEAALKAAGYTQDFSGYDLPDHYVTAHKGAQWVVVVAHEMTGESTYDLTTVLTQEMAQEMTADAAAWADAIGKTGRASVYGIEFDTAKSDLKPESEKVLNDVLSLLNGHADWKMRIEGHTDSTGDKAANKSLSLARAKAVVAWLTAHGVESSRLSPAGLGDTVPVADNSTVDGRARNRRVELVKQ